GDADRVGSGSADRLRVPERVGGRRRGEPAPRGTMTIAVPTRPHALDPLSASSPVDRLVSRQLFEPLVERLTGPYGDVRHLAGLARSVRPAAGRTLWRIRLRSRVRFQDGSPLDASAVAANAE